MREKPVATGVEEQLRSACADLDCRLRRGESCRAEMFLDAHPAIAAVADAAVELIYTEFVVREELGESAMVAEYLRRFPRWQAALQRQFEVHTALRDGAPDWSTSPVDSKPPADEQGVIAPKQIGAYEVVEEIARGAMGVIYKAHHRLLRRTVALKMILAGSHAGPAARARFRTEAEAAARLHHPNIVQIYDVGEHEGRPYLTLEYIEGGSLASRLHGQPQDPRQAAELVRTLAMAVDYAHRRGIVHRDLKPGNILLQGSEIRNQESEVRGQNPGVSCLTPDPWPLTPKIADFGLAKFTDRTGAPTESGAIFGTPSYMAPEQASGHNQDVGAAADVYALGAMLYELLVGRPPFRAENLLVTLQQVVYEEPVPPERLQADLPRDLATICMKCLQKEPWKRYATAGGLAADLHRWLSGEPVQARPVSVWECSWKWARRRPTIAALLGAVSVAALALLTLSLWYNARLRTALTESDRRGAEAQLASAEALKQRLKAEDRGKHLQAAVEELRQKGVEHQAAIEDLRRNRTALQSAFEKLEQKNAEAKTAIAEVRRREKLARRQASLLERQTDRLSKQIEYTRQLVYTMQLAQAEETWPSDPSRARAMLEDTERCSPEMHDFAWRLYHHLCAQDRIVETAHGGALTAVAYSAKGDSLATAGGAENTIELWDTPAFRKRAILEGHDAPVTCLAFSPDGRTLASGSEDHTIRIWDVRTGQPGPVLEWQTSAIRSLAFSADSHSLASGAKDGTICTGDTTTGKLQQRLLGHKGPVLMLHFGPEKGLLTSAGADRSVRTWDLVTMAFDKQRTRLVLGDSGPIASMAISADGKHLAIASGRRPVIELFELRPDELVHRGVLQGHVDTVHQIVFSPDGALIASGSEDQTVRLWDTATGSIRLVLRGQTGDVRGLTFAADGQTLMSADEATALHVYALPARLPEMTKPSHKRTRLAALAFSPDGRMLASAGQGRNIDLFETATMRRLGRLRGPVGPIWALAFSPDGDTLAVAGDDGSVELWNTHTRKRQAAWRAHDERVRAVRFSPDRHTLATASEDGTVVVWRLPRRAKLATLEMDGPVFSIGFTPNGRALAVGTSTGQVTLWNMHGPKVLATMIEHEKAVLFTEFSPDGRVLVTGGKDSVIKVWDWPSLELRSTLPWTGAGYAFSASFSPDSRTLAIGGGSRAGRQVLGEVRLWDVISSQPRATLQGQSGPAVFASDNTALATVQHTGQIRLWRAETPPEAKPDRIRKTTDSEAAGGRS